MYLSSKYVNLPFWNKINKKTHNPEYDMIPIMIDNNNPLKVGIKYIIKDDNTNIIIPAGTKINVSFIRVFTSISLEATIVWIKKPTISAIIVPITAPRAEYFGIK